MPRPFLIALALTVSLVLGEARADSWIGPDKALHFSVAAGIAAGGYGAAALATDDRRLRVLAGASLSLAAGIAKEVWDSTGRGDPSWKDLAWDAAGAAVGVGLALLVDALFRSRTPDPERSAGSPTLTSELRATPAGALLRF